MGCTDAGVRGYPAIKYGDPNNLEDYKGGRSLKDLQSFAKENLGPTCGPANLDLCDDEKKAQINKFMAMSASDLTNVWPGQSGLVRRREEGANQQVHGNVSFRS